MKSETSAEAEKVRNSCRLLKVYGISGAEDIARLRKIKPTHILRQRRAEFHDFSGNRMGEF